MLKIRSHNREYLPACGNACGHWRARTGCPVLSYQYELGNSSPVLVGESRDRKGMSWLIGIWHSDKLPDIQVQCVILANLRQHCSRIITSGQCQLQNSRLDKSDWAYPHTYHDEGEFLFSEFMSSQLTFVCLLATVLLGYSHVKFHWACP